MAVFLSIIFTLTFLIGSLILNFFQLCIYWLIRPFNKHIYRTINYYLIYSSWSLTLGITEWWGGSRLRLYADEDFSENFGKEHTLVLMNHKYEVDWIVTWMIADKFNVLGGSKCFAKKSLRSLPIIGWAWIFCEMIFLERNWEKDSKLIGTGLDNILEYKDTACVLLLFPEGTRYTEDKHKASIQFAKDHNLPELKYHLLPRTKGFNFCVAHLKDKITAIYDVQLGFPKDENPSVLQILQRRRILPDLYMHRIPMEKVPTESEAASSEFLYDLYRKKDKLMEEYWKTGKFPGKCTELKPRIWSLLNLIFWTLVVGLPIVYYLLKIILLGNTTVILITSSVVVLVLTGIYYMLGVTQVKKGSDYGVTTNPPPKKASTFETNGHKLIEESADLGKNTQKN